MKPEVGSVTWRDPREVPPPQGRKILLLTSEGTAIIGQWYVEGKFCGWLPLPRETQGIKELRKQIRGY